MRCYVFLIVFLISTGTQATEPSQEPILIARPDAFPTLVHPLCSHCQVEADRRKDELRPNDRVLCWMQVVTDGYINDGVIPLRFFLNAYRVLDDGWGQFVCDPDAGFARGFAPDDGSFVFHGWRNGVMVMKSTRDGTLYSCLSGAAFEGPNKGKRLQPRPTLVSDWGFWQKRYPQSVAYFMYDQYAPLELPTEVNDESRASRGPVDGRLPADTMVLGVWDGKRSRAYPLDTLESEGVIHDLAGGEARVVFWYAPTRTAAAYRQPWGTSGIQGDVGWIFQIDPDVPEAPYVDQRTRLHWDITGRPIEGGPRLVWLDSVQVKWFAWAAEYPETSIYGQEAAEPDFRPMATDASAVPGPFGNLDVDARRFAILENVDCLHGRVTLLLDGDAEPTVWPLRRDAEVRYAGWWGRPDQLTPGDRVWVWFDTTLLTMRSGKPVERTVRLADAEMRRALAMAPLDSLKAGEEVHVQTTGDEARLILDPAAFEKRRADQIAVLRRRWINEGLPGSVVFAHPRNGEIEVMLDHEAMRWGRSLEVADIVTLDGTEPIQAEVRQLRPWRERTQVLLAVGRPNASLLSVGQRVHLRLAAMPSDNEGPLPPGLGKSGNPAERLEWILSGIYCTCGMHDGCAGHCYTLAACNHAGDPPCGLAKRTRAEIALQIDEGRTDQQIFEALLQERGGRLVRPHLSP
jgi:hypothetical protein